MNPIRIAFNAAIDNPNDPAEVTIIADAVGVGRTHRLATGQVITWTAELLRRKAHTFIGKPVNIDLDEDGEPTGHSRRVVGAITEARFDETKQVITVRASAWPHYSPSTVARIKELGAARLHCSMEFIPLGEMIANADGSESPTDGEFSGLGIVRVGADPRNRVILVAALAEDAGNIEVSMNLDQITEAVARKLGHREPDADAATKTVTDDATADSEEIIASPEEEDATPVSEGEAPLETTNTDELKASLREELLAELKPQLDELTRERDEARQTIADRDAADAKKELVTTRMAELETISPAEGAGKERREALCAALEDESFAAYKADVAEAAGTKGGAATDAERHAGTEDADKPLVSDDQAQEMAGRALAAAGLAAPAKDK